MDSANKLMGSRKSSGELRYYEDGDMQEEQLGFGNSNTRLPDVDNTPHFSATNAQFVSDIMQRTADVPLRPDVRNSRNAYDKHHGTYDIKNRSGAVVPTQPGSLYPAVYAHKPH